MIQRGKFMNKIDLENKVTIEIRGAVAKNPIFDQLS